MDRESAANTKQPADLTIDHYPPTDNDNCCGLATTTVMKSSSSSSSWPAATVVAHQQPGGGRADSETDPDGSRTAKRPPSAGGRATDEVSGRSVRDKIAMFSRATTGERKDSAYSTAAGSSDSSPAASPKAAGAAHFGSCTLPRRPPPTALARSSGPAAPLSSPTPGPPQAADQHRRSLSLVEQPYSKYFNTMNTYAEMGRSSLNALIEQRRRSMSKLRGLVIPEKASTGGCNGGVEESDAHPTAAAIPDLPLVIKTTGLDDVDIGGGVLCPPTKTYVNGPPPVVGTATRRANPVKTVAAVVIAATATRPAEQPEQRRPSSAASSSSSSSPPSSSPPSSSSASSSSSSLNSSREELRHIHDERPPSTAKLSGCDGGGKGSFKADSDEDSALSSGRSSASPHQYSPAPSPPPPLKSQQPPPPNVVATVARSEVGKRVLKAESVEAINRKNVLCSARISSGKPEAPLFANHVVAQKTDNNQQQQQHLHSADKTVTKTAAFAIGPVQCGNRYTHMRMSSVESTTSDESSMQYAVNAEPFGSISSLASSTSLISQQELQQLIDDANQTLEENGVGGCGVVVPGSSAVPLSVEVTVVILHRDVATSSVGITLAGGADYETKEITVSALICTRRYIIICKLSHRDPHKIKFFS